MADQRLAERIAREVERLSKAFARQLRTVLRDAEQRMRGEIARVEQGGRLPFPSPLGSPRLQVRRVLDDAGADALMTKVVTDGLPIMARLTMRQRVPGPVVSLETINARLAAIRLGHYDDLIGEVDRLAREVSQMLLRAGLTERKRKTIAADIAGSLDAAEGRLQTLHDTIVSIYGREAEAVQAGNDPDTIFAYMGPVDEKTRDFCLELAGKVFTRSEIDDLDNGQLDNVFLTGGGYNCRHIWMEVSKFSELADLVGTERRAPEVQEAVDAIQQEEAA